jgi:(p)ppGpp synthase/HD superfamily hydrolase
MDGLEMLNGMARTDFVERSPLTRDALAFASARHEDVRHPVEVACLLHEAGYSDEVVAAGVLHDVLEDTDTEPGDLVGRFGVEVTTLVAAVSDDPTIEDETERKAALRAQVARGGDEVAAVFAADKVSKARELRLRMGGGRFERADRTRLEHYEASLEMLSELLPGHALVERLREELGATLAGSQ